MEFDFNEVAGLASGDLSPFIAAIYGRLSYPQVLDAARATVSLQFIAQSNFINDRIIVQFTGFANQGSWLQNRDLFLPNYVRPTSREQTFIRAHVRHR